MPLFRFGEKLRRDEATAKGRRKDEAVEHAAKEAALMAKAGKQGGATPSQSRKQSEAEKQAQKEKGDLRILSISLSCVCGDICSTASHELVTSAQQ